MHRLVLKLTPSTTKMQYFAFSKLKIEAKTFSIISNMRTHELSHDSKNHFKCKICGKYFSILANLKRHEKILRGDKSYKCNFCEKHFMILEDKKKS